MAQSPPVQLVIRSRLDGFHHHNYTMLDRSPTSRPYVNPILSWRAHPATTCRLTASLSVACPWLLSPSENRCYLPAFVHWCDHPRSCSGVRLSTVKYSQTTAPVLRRERRPAFTNRVGLCRSREHGNATLYRTSVARNKVNSGSLLDFGVVVHALNALSNLSDRAEWYRSGANESETLSSQQKILCSPCTLLVL